MNLSSYIFSGIVMIRVGLFNDILRFGYVLCIILYFCCILFIFNCTDNLDFRIKHNKSFVYWLVQQNVEI